MFPEYDILHKKLFSEYDILHLYDVMNLSPDTILHKRKVSYPLVFRSISSTFSRSEMINYSHFLR